MVQMHPLRQSPDARNEATILEKVSGGGNDVEWEKVGPQKFGALVLGELTGNIQKSSVMVYLTYPIHIHLIHQLPFSSASSGKRS